MTRFTTEHFVEQCQSAHRETNGQQAVLEVVERAVSNPAEALRAFGEPQRAGIQTLYHAADLTILNLSWGPGMKIGPHNHEMWAVIGIYGGRENNTFYRREDASLKQFGNKELNAGDAVPLGDSIIHGVTNPLDKLTCAIHVYDGDFFDTPRSEWNPDTLIEQPYNVENTRRAFEQSNERLDALRKQR